MRGLGEELGGARVKNAAPVSDEEAAGLFALWSGAPGVVMAVSGGPDSIALMGLAARWRGAGGTTPLLAATFDHGLRPGSAKEARDVKGFAHRLGLEHRTLKWTGDKPGTRLQERARDARHEALAGLARRRGFTHVALAHHLDDQAETVLMRIAAGTGIDGLGAMREVAAGREAVIHRPFLSLSKVRLIATCRAHGWPFIEDPSNTDVRFARARWRALTPSLAAEGLTADRLSRLAARARRAEDALEAMVDAWFAAEPPQAFRGSLVISGAAWAHCPPEMRLRIVRRLIGKVAAGAAAAERLDRMEQLSDGLSAAALEKRPFSRNLRGVLVRLDRSGGLSFAPEPARRQGRRSS